MILPDMRELVVECQIPEAELARVEIGREVTITPLSYPDLRLHGRWKAWGPWPARWRIARPGSAISAC
jgi:multidrug resistance efflux pump